jgi:hypothetical protein
MIENSEQRKARRALFSREAQVAMSDYRVETDAVIARTARLRAERLERDSVIQLPAPHKKAKAASRPRKATPKAPMRQRKPSARLKVV